jgi:hypothetical protein
MLLVIAFQPGADRAAHFGRMALTSLAHAVLPACQHSLPQPIRGRPAHLESCRLHRFAPRASLKHGASRLNFCHSLISCLHGGLLPAKRGMRHAALGMNHPRWNKACGGRRCERHQPVACARALAGAGAVRRRSDARCAAEQAPAAQHITGNRRGVHATAPFGEGGWGVAPPRTLPSRLKPIRERPINSAAAPARPPRRAPAPKSPHKCPSRSTGTSRSGPQADS